MTEAPKLTFEELCRLRRVFNQHATDQRIDEWLKALIVSAAAVCGSPWAVKRPTQDAKAAKAPRRAVTPKGAFATVAAAAEAFGISRQAAWSKVKRQVGGWRYSDETEPAPVRKPRGRPAGRLDSKPRKPREK